MNMHASLARWCSFPRSRSRGLTVASIAQRLYMLNSTRVRDTHFVAGRPAPVPHPRLGWQIDLLSAALTSPASRAICTRRALRPGTARAAASSTSAAGLLTATRLASSRPVARGAACLNECTRSRANMPWYPEWVGALDCPISRQRRRCCRRGARRRCWRSPMSSPVDAATSSRILIHPWIWRPANRHRDTSTGTQLPLCASGAARGSRAVVRAPRRILRSPRDPAASTLAPAALLSLHTVAGRRWKDL